MYYSRFASPRSEFGRQKHDRYLRRYALALLEGALSFHLKSPNVTEFSIFYRIGPAVSDNIVLKQILLLTFIEVKQTYIQTNIVLL